MSRQDRGALIRRLWFARLGISLSSLPILPTATRSEVATTIHSYSDRTRTDDSVLDEGVEVDSLSRVEQALETSPTGWHDTEAVLTRAERARLAREVIVNRFQTAIRSQPLLLTA